MNAGDFSRYEFCGRLPSLFRMYEPNKLPVREATKRYFERGVRYHFSGVRDVPDTIRQEFVQEASQRGYDYPAGEPYIIAQDHAEWLYGVLHLLPHLPVDPLPLIDLEDKFVEVDGYAFGDTAHLFKVVEHFDSKLRWPELLLAGKYNVVLHQFRLPRVTVSNQEQQGGRLCSPANMAYRHPLTGNLRLALFEGREGKRFAKSWRRVGRWEEPDIGWDEWRLGIERDQCIDQIYRAEEVNMNFTASELQDIHRDAVQMAQDMDRPHPRKRERCPECMFFDFCHGGEDGRINWYIPVEQSVRGMRSTQTAGVLS